MRRRSLVVVLVIAVAALPAAASARIDAGRGAAASVAKPLTRADVTGTITPGGPGDRDDDYAGRQRATDLHGKRRAESGARRYGHFVGACELAETVQILKPDDTSIGSTGAISTAGWIDTKTLDTAGTHTVFVDPIGDATGSNTLTLYEVPADVSTPITIRAGPVTATINSPGQNAELPFSGAQGQQVRILGSQSTITAMNVMILNPDGSVLSNSGLVGTSYGTQTATLPTTGTYKVLVDPFEGRTGSVTLKLRINGDSPTNGASIDCATPVLRAEPNGAWNYQFQVASDAGFANVVDDSGTLEKTNTYTVPVEDLSGNGSYYWRWKSATTNWSAGRSFTQQRAMLGVRDYWPIWSLGQLAVNQANGNLVVSLPGPSYPTAVGSLAASATYNSLDPQNRGLGTGWVLVGGDEDSSPPAELVDHNLLTGAEQYDAVEVVGRDGSSTCFTHVAEANTYVSEPGDGSVLAENQDGTWTLTEGDGAIYTFGVPDGATGTARLASTEVAEASPGNGKLSYTFSTQDPTKVTSITDVGSGRSLTFSWNSLDAAACGNAIVCVSGPDGVVWRYVGDGPGGTSGQLARVNNGTRDLFAVSYDGSGRVNKLQNANDLDPSAASPGYDGDHSVTIGYDGNGKVASVNDGPINGQTPATSTWTFAYTPGNVQTTPTRAAHGSLPAGTARAAAGFTTVTPPRQQGQQNPKSTKTYYDSRGHPLEVVDLLGNKTMSGYTARDQLLWSEDEDGNPTDYAYDSLTDALLSVTGPDPDGGGPLARPITRYRYDETQIGTADTAGAALQGLRAEYFENTNLSGRPKARRTDANVDVNWGSGGPTALPGVTDNFSVRWSGYVNVTTAGNYYFSTVSDEGTRLVVDGIQLIDNWRDQTVTTTNAPAINLSVGLHKIALEYYDRTGPAEVHLRWECFWCGFYPAQVIAASRLRPGWTNQTSVVSPLGRIAFSHYADPASGLPDYTLEKLSDGTNVITSLTYDAFGRMTQKVMPKGNAGRTIDAGGNLQGSPNTTFATNWSYYGVDEAAPPPSVCGGGAAVGQAGLPKSTTPSGIATKTIVYDVAGRPIARTRGTGTICRTYTTEGRLASEIAPGETQATTYTYDPAGALRGATDASGTTTSEYDEGGRTKRRIDSFGAEATFLHDAEGNRVRRVAAAGALSSNPNYTTDYGYDDANHLAVLTDPAGRQYTFFYDNRGNLKATQYPNATFAWLNVNAAGRLDALYNRHGTLSAPLPGSVPADSQGSSLSDFAYTYNLDGAKTQEVRTGGGLASETT